MNLEAMINHFAQMQQISDWGIAKATPLTSIKSILEQRNPRLAGFVEQDIEKRITPSLALPDAKSIIVFAKSYKMEFLFSPDNQLRGSISMGAIGEDYHAVLTRNLEQLATELKKHVSFQYRIFVDTGPLVDREVARLAGIGWIGKSGMLISPKAGSMIFLGMMITNLSLTPSSILSGSSCGNCHACITCCPGGAIGENGQITLENCISYLTQSKELLSIPQMKQMKNCIYGCDVCQLCCPKNQNIAGTPFFNQDTAAPLLEEILQMNNKTFREKFQSTAAGWRGKKILQRNALIALGNSHDSRAIPLLEQFCLDERPLIQKTAQRALKICLGEA